MGLGGVGRAWERRDGFVRRVFGWVLNGRDGEGEGRKGIKGWDGKMRFCDRLGGYFA